MDKYIGKLLGGRYEIIDVVGVGGMAVVYRARDMVLGRYVAVKILKDEYARGPGYPQAVFDRVAGGRQAQPSQYCVGL